MKKRLFAGLLALCMVFNVMPATAFAEEATTEPVVTEVVCEAKEDCKAETHIETCAKYVAPVVVCEGAEDCVAETHIETCAKYPVPVVVCEGAEECAAETHIEGCAKYVAPVVVCEAKEECAAETHIETCAKYVIPCTNDEDCLAEEHVDGCPADVVYLQCPTEGCELVEGHPGECTGAITYETTGIDTEAELKSALEAGGTVVLTGDIEVTAQIDIPAGVDVTLDLAGNNITSGYQSESSSKHIYPLSNNGKLTIVDQVGNGSVEGRGIYNQDGATLVVDGAKIVAKDWNGGACVWNYGTGEVYLSNATMIGNTGVVYSEGYLEINGGTYTCYSGIKDDGTFDSPTYNIRAYNGLKITDGVFKSRHGVISVGGGEAVIEDGSYTIEFKAATTSNVVYIYGDADLTIEDGAFISDDSADKADSGAAVLVSGSDAKLTINDGTYVGMNGMIGGNSNTVINAGEFSTVWDYNHYGKLEEYISADTKIIDSTTGNGWAVVPKTYVTELEGEGTVEKPYLIKNVHELKWFRDQVNSGRTYSGKYIQLTDSVDLNNEEWTPIGTSSNNFQGIFDGNEKTISNLLITGTNSNAGLFGFTTNGEIKNVTVENAKVSGRLNVGVVAGTPYTSKYSNVTVKGHVEVNGMSYVGGVGGKNAYANWTDIKVEVDETSYVKATSTENGTAYRTYVGGVIGFMGEGGHSFKNIVSNIDVIGDVCDIGGITGIAHYNNKFENVTCSGNVTNTNTDAEDVKETGGIAGVWHNEKGTTVTFTNCKYTGKVTAANKDVTATNNITGAPYNASNDTIANSGKLVIDGNLEYPVVAEADGVKYATLQDAINAAKAGDTVNLLDSVDLDGTVTVSNEKIITLNLNGYNITGKPVEAKAYTVIENKGNLTITGEGSVVCNHTLAGSTSYAVNTITNLGTLNVNGGTIENKSTAAYQIGYAIDNNSTSYDAKVVINGGTVKASGSAYYDGIRQFCNNVTKTNSVEVKNGSVSTIWLQNPSDGRDERNTKDVKGSVVIAGGTVDKLYLEPSKNFEAEITSGYVGSVSYNETSEGRDLVGFITGGTFGTNPSKYVAEGYEAKEVDNKYVVQEKPYIAQVGNEKYKELQKAVDAASNGGKVTLLQDATGAGVVIKKDITIDFAGYIYTVNSAVGSAGTEALAFQILAGSNAAPYDVTLKNGTIAVVEEPVEGSKELKAVVMNYSNLTLENVTVDGTGNKEMQFALSTNNGTLTLKGNTSIKVNGSLLALDVDGSQPAYNEAKAIIDTTGVISGRVDIYGNEADVVIKNGGFNGAINVNASLTENDVMIEGGYFTQTPPSKYIYGDKVALLLESAKVIDGVTYLYTIGEKVVGEPEKAVTPAEPKVETKLPATATDEQKETANQIANPTTGSATTSFESTLPEASEVAKAMDDDDHAEALETLNKTLEDNSSAAVNNVEDVTIHVRPYIDVQVKDVDIPTNTTEAPVVTLDISMKYNLVASTEKDAENIVTAEDAAPGETVNSVVLNDEPEILEVEKGTPVEITVPLPSAFNAFKHAIVVKHVKDDGTVYYYDATVDESDGTITFINPNGFSTFVITADSRTAIIDFKDSANSTTQTNYNVTTVNTIELPTDTKAGYIFKGWSFAGVAGGPYSGQMTEALFDDLAAAYNANGNQPIEATPVFVEAPKPSSGDSDDDNIAEEVETEKEIETDSTDDETVRAGKDELKELIGHSYGLYNLALSLKLEGELDETTDIRIKVDEASIYDDVIILQKTENGWKTVPAYAEDGYVVGKFTSLSEILIFLNPNGLRDTPRPTSVHPAPQATTPAGTTPAATGDSANVVGYIAAIAVAAVGLTVLFFRKRRA